jgi:hypothetical protein
VRYGEKMEMSTYVEDKKEAERQYGKAGDVPRKPNNEFGPKV